MWLAAYCARQSLQTACPHQVTCHDDGSSGSQKQMGQVVPATGIFNLRRLSMVRFIPRNTSRASKSFVPCFRPAHVCQLSTPALAAIADNAISESCSEAMLLLLLLLLLSLL